MWAFWLTFKVCSVVRSASFRQSVLLKWKVWISYSLSGSIWHRSSLISSSSRCSSAVKSCRSRLSCNGRRLQCLLVGLQSRSATDYMRSWIVGSTRGHQSASMGKQTLSKEVLLFLPDTHNQSWNVYESWKHGLLDMLSCTSPARLMKHIPALC